MREKGLIVWIMLAAVLLAVLNLPESVSQQVKAAIRDGVAPLQAAITGLGRGLREAGRALRGSGGRAAENRRLAAELVNLRNEVRELKALERENAGLRQQLRFFSKSALNLLPCEVIARDITGWWQTIRLNKGTADGVLPNMAVITTDGLVGKTVSVSARTADVLLISDPTCQVSAQIARTEAYGVVSGRGPASRQVFCRMAFINKDIAVQPGDEVITSGLGGVFPRGLPIGSVDKITRDAGGLYQTAEVVPRADLKLLEYVFVVQESEPGAQVGTPAPAGGEGR